MTQEGPIPMPKARTREQKVARNTRRRQDRRAVQLRLGNTNALRHGVFAEVLNAEDIATEAMLLYAAHTALDPVKDRRLVEWHATNLVQRQRALLAIARDGMTAQLTSYDSRLSALVERGERAIFERVQVRTKEAQAPADLSRYAVPRAVAG